MEFEDFQVLNRRGHQQPTENESRIWVDDRDDNKLPDFSASLNSLV